jgi:hypothetical protein
MKIIDQVIQNESDYEVQSDQRLRSVEESIRLKRGNEAATWREGLGIRS